MTDIELLEQAARAIGGVYHWEVGSFYGEQDFNPIEIPAWNPLENSDDAFDLMIKLGLRFEYFAVDPFEVSGKPVCVITWAPGGVHNRELETLTGIGNDVSAVVRTLIVRAASKIGSRMP